jgi:hypothetical protein
MGAQENKQTAQAAYQAFSSGDAGAAMANRSFGPPVATTR